VAIESEGKVITGIEFYQADGTTEQVFDGG